ncbi:MAG: glycosyltransferase [Spirosomataceae bacterium]
MKKILISDFRINRFGHNLGWIQNVYDYLKNNPDGNHYSFLLNPDAKNSFQIPTDTAQIKTFLVPDSDFATMEAVSNPPKRFKLQWEYIKSFGEKLGIDKLIVMEMDMYLKPIGDSGTSFKISGIWFQPYYRIQTVSSSLSEKVKILLQRIRKRALIWWTIHHKNFDKVFILNDHKAVAELNYYYQKVFHYLPDPAFDYPFKEGLEVRKYHNIDSNRVVFLIFGAIDNRKNVINILRAFQSLSPEIAQKAALLIIGKVAGFYVDEFSAEIEKTRSVQPNLSLITESRFVDDEEMESYFSQSDVILRMNVNFFASSGIVGSAAKFNKPLIVSDYGLVAEQIIEHKLGKLANPDNIEEIKTALIDYIEKPELRNVDGQEFYRTHDRDFTIKTLLS